VRGEWINVDGLNVHICYSGRRKKKMEPKKPLTWPATRNELYAAGYKKSFKVPVRKCKLCPALLEFWQTPDGKMMPIEVQYDGKLVSHFATCPEAGSFRRPDLVPKSTQKRLFEK
jgi:hypothetical protein